MIRAIITHGDTDGICSSAVIKCLFPSIRYIDFAHPTTLANALAKLPRTNILFILDLAIDKVFTNAISSQIERLINLGTAIVYIDHHPFSDFSMMRNKGTCLVIHDPTKAASQLAYNYVKLTSTHPIALYHAKRISIMGAMGDRFLSFDSYPQLKEEAIMLDNSWRVRPDDSNFKRMIINELARGKLPSEITEVVESYQKAKELYPRLLENLEKNIVYEDEHMVVSKPSEDMLGFVGIALSELSQNKEKIAVAIRSQGSNTSISISARASRKFYDKLDLGKMFSELSQKMGGSGGGHALAASANLTIADYEVFVKELRNKLQSII